MDRERSQWIDEILQQAMELEGEARVEFLDRACAGDAELRREVESMLSGEIDTGEILKHSPAADSRRKAQPDVLGAGEEIGHYRIESLIGRGGMGEVYLARDERLQRMVALKALPAEFTADAERVRRFEQEAIAASRLNHPNIITIFEIAQVGGAWFIAAEYVEGQTLREMMTDEETKQPRRLGVEQSLKIAIQIADALKAAHTAWIIHRDIKPENVMIRKDGLVKVLDFGIAKVGDGETERQREGETGNESVSLSLPLSVSPSGFTVPGTILGTASYMSPEQARGETLDGRTDVFSLGATLYEMVTGERLMAGVTRAAATGVLRGEQEPLKPQARFDHAPKELERIIRKSLRRNREERYASAGEMLDDLNALKRRLDSRASRRMIKLGALAILLAALFVAVAAWLSVNETWAEQVMRDGHTAAARRAVFSPDGRLLVSVGEDNRVIVWDFARREQLANFDKDHTGRIISVAFSPDSKWFATASSDKTVIVWDAVNLKKEITLREHRHEVFTVAFTPDGKTLVSAASPLPEPIDDGTILWRTGSWESFARIPAQGVETGPLLFPPGSSRMIYPYKTSPASANTWDVTTGRPLDNQFDPSWNGNNAALSPDGALLVSITSGGEVIFADFKGRRTFSREQAHQDNGRAVAFSPDGRMVVTGAENIVLWDTATRQRITTIDYQSIVWSAAFSPDGHWLVTTHGDGSIRVWDMVERRQAVGFNEHNGSVRAVAWSPDGRRFASAGEDRVVMVWNAENGNREMALFGHSTRVTGLAFAPDGGALASVDLDGTVIIRELAGRRERLRFGHPVEKEIPGNCLVFSPDGRVLATSHGVYDSASGRQVAAFNYGTQWLTPNAIYGLAFSADGKRLAVANSYGVQSILDTSTWQIAERAELRPRSFISASFSPDGEHLVTGEDGKIVQLWTAQPLRPAAVIGKHDARVKSVAFSPDGSTVVSAGDDKMIALWDVGGRKLITKIGLHTAPVYAVAFSPDGKRLISGGHDHSVRLYTRRRALWGWRLD